ncbi:hypothetical protein CEXT_447461 [Caerostris extrusa]|uniref:Uncharacterized protein n=1 Tax=Caerostris extrusa TaxID=172846 RepID=A0AAV4VZ03_CAEEX|nr:hypothetical protein CEXT_447461 [Caerostris extrusa]
MKAYLKSPSHCRTLGVNGCCWHKPYPSRNLFSPPNELCSPLRMNKRCFGARREHQGKERNPINWKAGNQHGPESKVARYLLPVITIIGNSPANGLRRLSNEISRLRNH